MRSICVVLAVFALAAASAAASPTTKLVAKLKKDLNASVKASLGVIAAERQIALTQMKVATTAAKGTVLTPMTAVGVLIPMVDFQTSLRTRIDDGLIAIVSLMRTATIDFHLLDPTATALPIGLTFGDGGVGDAAEANFLHKVDGMYGPLRKSIAAYAKAVRTKSNIGFTMLVRPPAPPAFTGFTESVFYSSSASFSLDVACGISDLGVADDGIIIFGGSANINLNNVAVEVNGPDFTTSSVAPDPTTGAWLFLFDKAGQGVKEASYDVRANQGTNSPLTNWHIGVQ